MALSANELRIGNYVWEDYSGEMIVSMLNDVDGSISLRKNKTLPFGLYGIKDIEPIPLTEQWLKDLGFHKNNDRWHKSYPFYIKWCDWTPEGWWALRDVDIPIRLVEHVHQLQNLYFALTGKELTK